MSTAEPERTDRRSGWTFVWDSSVNVKDFPVWFSNLDIEDFIASNKWASIACSPLKKSLQVSDVMTNPGGTLIPILRHINFSNVDHTSKVHREMRLRMWEWISGRMKYPLSRVYFGHFAILHEIHRFSSSFYLQTNDSHFPSLPWNSSRLCLFVP